MAIFKQ